MAARVPAHRLLVLSDARSGSSYACSLLRCNERVILHGELLNEEVVAPDSASPEAVLAYLDKELSTACAPYFEGFKLHLDQLRAHRLDVLTLIRRLNVQFVVLVWRNDLLEQYVSLKIAEKTGVWYSDQRASADHKVTTVDVDRGEFFAYVAERRHQWARAVAELHNNVKTVSVEYSKLCADPQAVLGPVFRLCDRADVGPLETAAVRQNPAPLERKIANWSSLNLGNSDERELRVDQMIEKLNATQQLHKPEAWWPEPEPVPEKGAWIYRVAEPYIAPEAPANVATAVAKRAVSSAAYPVAQMGTALRSFFNVPVAQPCCNGFSALLLALQCARVGEGDLVLCPSFTMVAVPNSVHFLGATPVFVDNAPNAYNPSVEEYERAAAALPEPRRVKAVFTCHTYGVPADVVGLRRLCDRHGWVLVEDISECIGVRIDGRLLGTFGHYAGASMYANKTVTAGDGGFVLSVDASNATRLASLVNHGFTPRYHFIHFEPCVDAKISGLAAALAAPALAQIDRVVAQRGLMAKWYRAGLAPCAPHVRCMPAAGDADGPWVFGIECSDRAARDALRRHLADCGVETRNYFPSLDILPAFKREGARAIAPFACPNSRRLADTAFYLPSHYYLQQTDVAYICAAVSAFLMRTACPPPPRRGIAAPPAVLVDQRTGRFDAVGAASPSLRRKTLETVRLNGLLQQFFSGEREGWSALVQLSTALQAFVADGAVPAETRDYFAQYAAYLDLLRTKDLLLSVPIARSPWLDYRLQPSATPSTTPTEVQQLLCWLIATRGIKTVAEVGCLLGGTTVHLARALAVNGGAPGSLVAVDGFRWQEWMNERFEDIHHRAAGKNFLSAFRSNLAAELDAATAAVVRPLQVSVADLAAAPPKLDLGELGLVFLDTSDKKEDLEAVWRWLGPRLVHNKTVIVTNAYGAAPGVCAFVASHADELQPLHKPASFAKAFLYRAAGDDRPPPPPPAPAPRKVAFAPSPSDWQHRAGGFCSVVAYAKARLHDPAAEALFVPAVEQYFADRAAPLTRPWLGVMHQVPRSATVWVADGERIIRAPMFLASLRHCRGLFALTSFLCDWLRVQLRAQGVTNVPVSRLYYPLAAPLAPHQPVASVADGAPIPVVMIGGYMRNVDDFMELRVPRGFEKVVIDGDANEELRARAEACGVRVLPRLTDAEFERLFQRAVPFLSLASDGVASTLVTECLGSNTPVLARRRACLEEYLGADYPLFFDSVDAASALLQPADLQRAHAHLARLDKSKFTPEHFVSAIARSAAYVGLPCPTPLSANSERVDVTVCICSYKRTQHLADILRALLHEQDYRGRVEVVVWNNNYDRQQEVDRICGEFSAPIRVIHSSANYYCVVRLAMLPLMRGDWLLVCDDDMLPQRNFVSCFMDKSNLYGPKAVLCLHGHAFSQHHALNAEDPAAAWARPAHRDSPVKFVGDEAPTQTIHFAHADGALYHRNALRDVLAVDMPSRDFDLVDDYWMSFVLSHHYNYAIVKLGVQPAPYRQFVASANDPSVALYLNPRVQAARMQLYVHHMRLGWPRFPSVPSRPPFADESKASAWQHPFVGFNVPMDLRPSDLRHLAKEGVRVVRLGAVCAALTEDDTENTASDLAFLQPNFDQRIPASSLQRLVAYIDLLGQYGLRVIITLHRQLASVAVWEQLAAALCVNANVIGYDLVNEPYVDADLAHSVDDLKAGLCNVPIDATPLLAFYASAIEAIRRFDQRTPVVLESPFWANWRALRHLDLRRAFSATDPSLLFVSFHMYEPMPLTTRRANRGRYAYPGQVPSFNGPAATVEVWDAARIEADFASARDIVCHVLGLKPQQVFVGEVGIARDTKGAAEYLRDVLQCCARLNWSACIYAYREAQWSVMNYELGPTVKDEVKEGVVNFADKANNGMMTEIRSALNRSNNMYGIAA